MVESAAHSAHPGACPQVYTERVAALPPRMFQTLLSTLRFGVGTTGDEEVTQVTTLLHAVACCPTGLRLVCFACCSQSTAAMPGVPCLASRGAAFARLGAGGLAGLPGGEPSAAQSVQLKQSRLLLHTAGRL